MPTFFTDSGSLRNLQVTGSTLMSGSGILLQLVGSGSTIFSISGSGGEIFKIADDASTTSLFTVSTGSIAVLDIDSSKRVKVSGSLIVTGSITGSLFGTASWATNAQTASFLPVGTYNITSSWAVSSSRAVSASNAQTASFLPVGTYNITSSWAVSSSRAISSSVALTASFLPVGTYNITSSWATNIADAELTAIAGLSSAANRTIQFTGVGTAALVTMSLGTEAAYGGSITFTADTNPSGTSSLRQFYIQIGNMVVWQISLTYANAGTNITNISLTFPTEFPTPAIPTGFTGANVRLYNCDPLRLITSPTGTVTISNILMILRNSGDNGFVIAPTSTFASGAYRTFILSGQYFTA